MQKTGAGLHTASSCWWDNTSDGARLPARARPRPPMASERAPAACTLVHRAGSRTVRRDYKTMYCIATVFGLSV